MKLKNTAKKLIKKIKNYRLKKELIKIDSRFKNFEIPELNSFLVRKKDEKLEYFIIKEYETRNKSTINLINAANEEYKISDFDWVLINTDDIDTTMVYCGFKTLSYCVAGNDFERACPDFIFDHWRQTNLDDYENERQILLIQSDKPPLTDTLGWRGANTHPNRTEFVELALGSDFDVSFIKWHKDEHGKLVSNDFLSLREQQKKWRYIIDIEGRGYSGRLKLLLAMGRVVFMQERVYQEWYAEYLKPWVHYVPVKSDFSDLKENLSRIRSDANLEKKLINESLKFCENYLSRHAALMRWAKLLNKL